MLTRVQCSFFGKSFEIKKQGKFVHCEFYEAEHLYRESGQKMLLVFGAATCGKHNTGQAEKRASSGEYIVETAVRLSSKIRSNKNSGRSIKNSCFMVTFDHSHSNV